MTFLSKKILITGASSGIGKCAAVTLSKLGANVVLLARRENLLQETISECSGDGNQYYVVDLNDEGATEAVIKQSISVDGKPFDGFVHSAGIEATLPIKFLTKDTFENVLSINALTAFSISKILLKKGNFSSKGGSIVFVSSVMGQLGQPAKVGYCASKGALVAGSRALALELAGKKIRVNCISPGMVKSEMSLKILDSVGEESRQRIENMHPLGLGDVHDIANAIKFLISEDSKWITGTDMIVDGGYSAH